MFNQIICLLVLVQLPIIIGENPEPSSSNRQLLYEDFKIIDLPDRTICGLEKEGNRDVGKKNKDSGKFPWIAALEYKSKLTSENVGIKCFGSLISNHYVLTTAHCLLDKEVELVSVWLGDWKISNTTIWIDRVANSENSTVLNLKVKEQIVHPYYSNRAKNNDIGLIRLEKAVKFTDYIRPVCLPSINLPNPSLGTPLIAWGWGIPPNSLPFYAELEVAECNQKIMINLNQLCAGGEKDYCLSGPLMRTYPDSKTLQSQWFQEGIISWGISCGRPDYPLVYTRVSRYMNWILNHISDNS